MVIGVLALVAGLALVVWGAERFTDRAIHVAARLAISTFFLGAMVSGLEPENLASGAAATLGGLPQIALGTVVGSTIFLLTGALGLALLVAPMPVRIPCEGPVARVLSVIFFALVLWNDGMVSAPRMRCSRWWRSVQCSGCTAGRPSSMPRRRMVTRHRC